MKKTLKGFCISFTLSSFAIWVANEVFSSVVPVPQNKVEIPQKNIALFFQKNDFAAQPLKTERVAITRLSTLAPKNEEEGLSDKEIAELTSDVLYPIQIASVEDVADIPIEHMATSAENVPIYNGNAEEVKPQKLASKSRVPPVSDIKPKVSPTSEETQVIKIADASKEIATAKSIAAKDDADTDIIPLENSRTGMSNNKVEVVDKAPETQIAAASRQISVDTMSIEVNDQIDEPEQREWQEMSETQDNPWIVAKSNKFAKNNKAVEEYSDLGKESEVEKLLAPSKMEEEGKEIQTAEKMVKNILIPIPEDILNDENLTPQLVSPKKTPVERVGYENDVEDESLDGEVSESGKKKGFFESLTSLFSGGNNDDDDGVEEEDETSRSKKKKSRKKLIGSLRGENGGTKILPAEMRLSFQPGRAEISGQTLRWVQAFANKAAEDPNIILEIRIDKNSSYALQQRRLDLLHTVLDGNGIDASKINTVFTSREPNSFIIRTLKIGEDERSKMIKNSPKPKTNYQTW